MKDLMGPLCELLKVIPDVKVIRRPGTINVWEYPEFISAVKATKRKKLIMSGIVWRLLQFLQFRLVMMCMQ